MGAGNEHGGGEIRFEKPLWWALGLTSAFLVAEVVGGLVTNSLALLSDAAHMMTDVIALGVSLFAVRLSRRAADAMRTYGYARMEALGALINGALLFVVAGYILWEAAGRFRHPPEVATMGVLVIASIGLAVNLVSMRLLKAGSGSSLNIRGAYLEVWSDMLGSIGVIVGALVIFATEWTLVDPIVATLIGLWVLPRTWTLVREASSLLMQGVPLGVDMAALRTGLKSQPAVRDVHDLHVWGLGSRQTVLSAHVVLRDPTADPDAVRVGLEALLESGFDIHHSTLQIERVPCREGATHA